MPAARNQAVTVRRPLAKRMPVSSSGSRAAERRCSQWARARKALLSEAGREENDMAGSWTRDALCMGHRVRGAGLRRSAGTGQAPATTAGDIADDLPRSSEVTSLRAKYRTTAALGPTWQTGPVR